MNDRELLEELVSLADQAGLRVRTLRGSGDAAAPASSGLCRVRGESWVVLVASDSLEERLDVLARALRDLRSEWLEGRYLAPAVRARLLPEGEAG